MKTVHPSIQSRPKALTVVTVAILGGLVSAFHMGKIPGALLSLQQTFDLNLFQSGLVVSSFSLLSALFGLSLGELSRRTGACLAGTLGLLATAAGAAMGALAGSFSVLLVSRIVEGFGFLLVAVTMPGLVNRVCPANVRPLALGIWSAFIPTAMSLMLLSSPTILSLSGWRGLWWLSALLSLLLAGIFLFQTKHSGPPSLATKAMHPYRQQLRIPLLVSAIFSCYSALFAAVTAFLPTYWTTQHPMELEYATYLTSLVVVGNILGNITAGYLVGRGLSLVRILQVALLGGGGSAVLVFSGLLPLSGEMLAAGSFTFLAGMLPGAVFAHIGEIAPSPDAVPLTTGMIFQGAGIGQVLGPVGFGMMAGYSLGWTGGAGLLLVIGLVGISLIYWLPLRKVS